MNTARSVRRPCSGLENCDLGSSPTGNRSDHPCWPERTELVNARAAQRSVVLAHRRQQRAGRLHGVTERLPRRQDGFDRRARSGLGGGLEFGERLLPKRLRNSSGNEKTFLEQSIKGIDNIGVDLDHHFAPRILILVRRRFWFDECFVSSAERNQTKGGAKHCHRSRGGEVVRGGRDSAWGGGSRKRREGVARLEIPAEDGATISLRGRLSARGCG